MSSIFSTLKEFKEFKNNPPKSGLLHGALSGLRKEVFVLVPTDSEPQHRWIIFKLLIRLAWSEKATGSVSTGAVLSILVFFAEQPTQLLRTIIDDPDLEIKILEVFVDKEGYIRFSARGLDMSKQEDRYREIASYGPSRNSDLGPFVNDSIEDLIIRGTDVLQIAISTVTIQIWILLTKAVTAPDTAKDSEQRRWIKLVQQKRVDDAFRLKNAWQDIIREKIAQDISIRRLMVNILITINKATGTKGRLLETIADIGNYISEAGMASFFLTIKYGIETRYPPLALNEFQGDLTTMIELMKLYKEQGEKAPFLVILEEAVQTKFAPGNYALLWSYAMGVGVALDRSMNNLNFNRGFLDPNYFRLGQEIVNRMEGNIDTKMALDLGLTSEQIGELKRIMKEDTPQGSTFVPKGRVSGFSPVKITDTETTDESAEETTTDLPQNMDLPFPLRPTLGKVPFEDQIYVNEKDKAIQNMRSRFEALRAKGKKVDDSDMDKNKPDTRTSPSQSDNDIDVMNTV